MGIYGLIFRTGNIKFEFYVIIAPSDDKDC